MTEEQKYEAYTEATQIERDAREQVKTLRKQAERMADLVRDPSIIQEVPSLRERIAAVKKLQAPVLAEMSRLEAAIPAYQKAANRAFNVWQDINSANDYQ